MAQVSSAAGRRALARAGAACILLAAGASRALPQSALVPVQSRNARDIGVGTLLVASSKLADPNFAGSVVLLVHDDRDGIVGLILNRRTDVPISRVFDDLAAAKGRDDPAYLGGPVQMDSVFALLRSAAAVDGADHIFADVYLILRKNLLEQTLAARHSAAEFHVYLGYAGWTTDQLKQEINLGAWYTFPPDTKTVFDSDPDSLWQRMIRKTERQFASIRLRLFNPASAF